MRRANSRVAKSTHAKPPRTCARQQARLLENIVGRRSRLGMTPAAKLNKHGLTRVAAPSKHWETLALARARFRTTPNNTFAKIRPKRFLRRSGSGLCWD